MDQSLSKICNFADSGFEKMLGAIRNWERWSHIVAAWLPDILFGVITFEEILSVRVLELFLFLAGLQYEAGAYEKKDSQGIQ